MFLGRDISGRGGYFTTVFEDLQVTEIFASIQGESTHAGLPYVFVRLTGCNLRCVYCDTAYAFKGGTRMTQDQIVERVKGFGIKQVLLTGGEPLLQRQTLPLIARLEREGYQCSIETHGEVSIEAVPSSVRVVMDVKTPGSGMAREGFRSNVRFLKSTDEVKFVLCSEEDYWWSAQVVASVTWPTPHLLFSPVIGASSNPPSLHSISVSPKWVAEQIVRDRLPVRMQMQMHKWIWGQESRGV